jgi:hypothetical protein
MTHWAAGSGVLVATPQLSAAPDIAYPHLEPDDP